MIITKKVGPLLNSSSLIPSFKWLESSYPELHLCEKSYLLGLDLSGVLHTRNLPVRINTWPEFYISGIIYTRCLFTRWYLSEVNLFGDLLTWIPITITLVRDSLNQSLIIRSLLIQNFMYPESAFPLLHFPRSTYPKIYIPGICLPG